KRTGDLKRKTYLKPMSDKKKAAIAETRPERDRYKAESVGCAWHLLNGGLIVPFDGIHELMGGSTREEEAKRQIFWTTLCNPCHDAVQSDIALREKVLAAKAICDWHSIAAFQEKHKKRQIDVFKVIDALVAWEPYVR